MNAAMAEPDSTRKPGDSDMHRRQRGKNLLMFAALLAMSAIFFALTLVRMGDKL
jgi:uncharacterized membrane protein